MKNKGFTLVEIIAVITVLSIIMIIAFPAIGNVINNSKEAISGLNKRNLEEAAKLLGEEIFMCQSVKDEIISIMHDKFGFTDVTNCKIAKEKLKGGFDVELTYLKANGYFTDNSNKCSGTLFIYLDPDREEVKVDFANAECTS